MDVEREQVDDKVKRVFELLLLQQTKSSSSTKTSNGIDHSHDTGLICNGDITVERGELLERFAAHIQDDVTLRRVALEWLCDNTDRFGSIGSNGASSNVRFWEFVLRLATQLSSQEEDFKQLLDADIIKRLTGWHERGALTTPGLQLLYLKFLGSLVRHPSGIDWIKKNELWKVCLVETKKTIYIERESGYLLYNVLVQLDAIDDTMTCRTIVKQILAPYIQGIWFNAGEVVAVDDHNNHRILMSTLQMLEQLFIRIIDDGQPNRVAYYLTLAYNLHKKLCSSILASYNSEYLTKVRLILTYANIISYAFAKIPSDDTETQEYDICRFCIAFYNIIEGCIEKRHGRDIQLIIDLTGKLWNKMPPDVPRGKLSQGHMWKFADQILAFQLVPLLHAIRVCGEPNQYLEEFLQKVFSTTCEQTVRHLYAYRDVIVKENLKGELATKAAKGLVSSADYMHRESAILALQALIMILGQYAPHIEDVTLVNGKRCKNMVLSCANLLNAILHALQAMIMKYNFSWNDCIEATTIARLVIALLNNSAVTQRVAVQCLKLVHLSIEHFLSPNMVLLQDDLEGTSLQELGPTIIMRLKDNDADVRDATLELLYMVIELSRSKFPAFRKHLIVHPVCPLVYDLAQTDRDVYVRASAFKCIASMVTFKQFWTYHFSQLKLIDQLITMLRDESEGLIRKEIVGTLTAISNHQQVPAALVDQLFSTMAFVVTNDLLSDVKLNGLIFWKNYMEELFHNQGAHQGGKFPKETFSRESKKIVQLTPAEIRRRLRKIVNAFSEKGGFGVLLTVIYEESDLEVLQAAVGLINDFMGRLKTHGFEVVSTMQIDVSTRVSDEEIDHLARAYARLRTTDNITISENGAVNGGAEEVEDKIRMDYDSLYFKTYAKIGGDEFISLIDRSKLDQMIETKQEWLNGFTGFKSLVDDILLSFTSEPIDLECY